MKHQENVKKWFETHDKPSEQQFYNFFKWIRWIDENISVQDIEGLNKLLIAKADKQAFNTHLQDEILHPSENDRENWNGKLDKTGTSVNSLKLGDKLPSYYVAKQDVYNKQESDNALLLAMNEVVQMLLNNPDAEINSIQELLAEMTTADNALVSSIANKVSYVVPQNLTPEQMKIAQVNIGIFNKFLSIKGGILDSGGETTGLKINGSLHGGYISLREKGENALILGKASVVVGGADESQVLYIFKNRSFKIYTGGGLSLEITPKGAVFIAGHEVYHSGNLPKLVSYGSYQKLSDTEKEIVHKNIGIYNHTHNSLIMCQNNWDAPTLNSFNYASAGGGLGTAVLIGFVAGTEEYNVSFGGRQGRFYMRSKDENKQSDWTEIYHSGNLPKQTVAPISTVTTYTAKSSDVGNIVPLSNANAQIILNTASFPRIGDKALYFYKGTGTCKVATSGNAKELKNINDTLEFDGQNSMVEITKTGANEYFVCGQLIRA
ncbi:hypothetical protein [Tenacibaculum finnmarkense]|uniref:hypothetical protein n=2 Tax=Tenacibaculum finnmarkense TaxID=2781243 RepID=UPI001E4CF3F9|nr:hypothetical protein [Tenacibaculum finnmarkense]MCD8412726.1 hypothetical protein [Tenacibaculum finnmarkense genomovar ulcerans]MCG8207383.1 hypothetical protein [Tenacibaculum finnmarkense genomovar finnmarkense]MCG8765562.1 hypothetical protein [Tenacibaculum finnmarkense]MCG8778520.1 hypothetical protein [Tenacibaculum finnmarkense]MCG8844292.1 hypothetical protein [Tenacibaculum finnmarkense]